MACGPDALVSELETQSEDELQEELLAEDGEAEQALDELEPLDAFVEDEAEDPGLDSIEEEAYASADDGLLPDEPIVADADEPDAPPAIFPEARDDADDASSLATAEAELRDGAPRAALPPIQALFTNPHGSTAQRMALETALVRLIDKASRGATVRGAYYKASRPRVIDALARAKKRGVNVALALDESVAPRGSAVYRKLKALGSVRFCTRGACIGRGINHNKFVIISSTTDGARYVVWQSSANLQGGANHNNTVVVRNNKVLYDDYARYFSDLYRTKGAELDYNTVGRQQGGVQVYYSPNSKHDYVVNALRNVHCRTGGVRGTVRMAMAYFSGARGERVVQELDRLGRAGCAVEVLIADSAKLDRVSSAVRSKLKRAKLSLRNYAFTKNVDGIHSKYTLVDAAYGASKIRRQIVFTGTHNLTTNALRRNDETLMRVVNAAAYKRFIADYVAIRRHTRAL